LRTGEKLLTAVFTAKVEGLVIQFDASARRFINRHAANWINRHAVVALFSPGMDHSPRNAYVLVESFYACGTREGIAMDDDPQRAALAQ
jgi:hypothetical protein